MEDYCVSSSQYLTYTFIFWSRLGEVYFSKLGVLTCVFTWTGKENNFRKYADGQASTLGAPYDYGSLMHYGRNYFTNNGQDTIVPKDPNARIGQRAGLSDIDAWQLRKLYKCPGVEPNPRKSTREKTIAQTRSRHSQPRTTHEFWISMHSVDSCYAVKVCAEWGDFL